MESPNVCANCGKTIYLVEWIYGNEWRDELNNSAMCEKGEKRFNYDHKPKYVDY